MFFSLLAGFAAIGAAGLANRFLWNHLSKRAAVTLGAIAEEALKSGFALAAGASILLVHGFFGLAEALYEIIGRQRLGAGGAALFGHAVFGVLTIKLMEITGIWYLGIAGGMALHVLWNETVWLLSVPSR